MMIKMSDNLKRMEQALAILLQPELFKICEGCDSIVKGQTAICPNCKSYRFNDDVEEVVNQTKLLSDREQTSVTKDDLF